MKTLYTAEALATGAGRDGHVRTSDGLLDLDLARPAAMGRPGGSGESAGSGGSAEPGGSRSGTNPEQLFAAGYAGCFHSALQRVARTSRVEIHDSAVGARVSIGPRTDGVDGFQLAIALEVVLPGVAPGVARSLADAADQICPYSNAVRGNVEVSISVVDA